MSKIILIGGTPRSGKTTLARKLSQDLKVSWIPTDALESSVRQYVPEKEWDAQFPKTVLRKKTSRSNDGFYAELTTEEIVTNYRIQAKTLEKAIQAFISCAQADGFDYIIEGYHVTPELISKCTEANSENSGLILVNTNSIESVTRSRNSDVKNDWVRDKTKEEDTYPKIAAMLNLYSEKLIRDAKFQKVTVIDVSGSYEDKLNDAFQYLNSQDFK